MNQVKSVHYEPLFPKVHAILLDMSMHCMQTRSAREVAVWADRLQRLLDSFEAMKDDGAASDQFLKEFHQDVNNVIEEVEKLVSVQSLSFAQLELFERMLRLVHTHG